MCTTDDDDEALRSMTTKRSGTWLLSCGHKVTMPLDTNARHRCPTCKQDAIVIRREDVKR